MTNIGTENELSYSHNSKFLPGLESVVKTGVSGCFFDIGCWRGTKSLIAAQYLKKNNISNMKIYLLDTFDGHKNKSEIDSSWGFDNKLDVYKQTNIQDIEYKFNYLDFHNYEIIKGDIAETLPKLDGVKIAFATTDLNWYLPTKIAVTHLKKNLQEGGLFHEDDFNNITGITECINSFLDIKNVTIKNELFFYF
jgi:hypothetical protein